MSAGTRLSRLAILALAAGCTIDTTGNGLDLQMDGGAHGGMDAATATGDASPVGVDVGPDVVMPVDTGRVIPCAPVCPEDGSYCDTSMGVCRCPGPSYCCSGCVGPGLTCDPMTDTCVCDGSCQCAGCPGGMICGASGCETPPPPPCGGGGEMCCAGDMCDDAEHRCLGGTCDHCGGFGERCCDGGRCSAGMDCGPVSNRCYWR